MIAMATKKVFKEKSIDVAFGYLILRSARLLRYNFVQSFKEKSFDISPEQWLILNRLSENDGQTQVELADDVFNDKPNITRIIDSLEKKAYVRRERDASDRRAFRVFLTDKAKTDLPKMWQLALAVRQVVYKDLTEDDLRAMERISTILERNILQL